MYSPRQKCVFAQERMNFRSQSCRESYLNTLPISHLRGNRARNCKILPLFLQNFEGKKVTFSYDTYIRFKIISNRCNDKTFFLKLSHHRVLVMEKHWKINSKSFFLGRLYAFTREPLLKSGRGRRNGGVQPRPLFHGSVPRIINSFLISPILG